VYKFKACVEMTSRYVKCPL